jgi:hypothetical protein
VRLVAVRVLNCSGSGSTSGVVAGIDWVTSNHTTGRAVANMSLGGGVSTTLDNAVTRSIADGVTYGVAAGNESANACNGSPSRVPTLSGTGASLYSPECQATSTYTHGGVLDGPAGTDFDLYLQKRSGSGWSTVASGLSSAPDENVTYRHGRQLPLARLLLQGLWKLHARHHLSCP